MIGHASITNVICFDKCIHIICRLCIKSFRGLILCQIQGGVLIAMKTKFIADCIGMGSLIEGCAVYIRIKHSCGHLSILNIYAPNSVVERQEFWLQLMAKKPDVELWIIGGDFNMVEHPEERRGNANGTVQGAEKYAWISFV